MADGTKIKDSVAEIMRRLDNARDCLHDDFEVEESIISELDLVEYALIDHARLIGFGIKSIRVPEREPEDGGI